MSKNNGHGGNKEGSAEAIELTASQEIAMGKLLAGSTDAEAGEAAGRTRETVCRWRNHNPAFRAEFNRRQRERRERLRVRLNSLGDKALDKVESELETDAKLAWKLLEALDVTSPVSPGCEDPDVLDLESKFEPFEKEREMKKILRAFARDQLHELGLKVSRAAPDQVLEDILKDRDKNLAEAQEENEEGASE